MIPRQRYYGWYQNERFHLSLMPPDAPVRPSVAIDTVDDLRVLLAARKRIEVYWWPPLPDAINAEIKGGLRLEGRR